MAAPACAHHSRAAHDGAVTGGLMGAVAGGLLTGDLGGMIVGGAIGAVIGNELGEQADRDARAAARSRQTVVYVSEDRSARVVSAPIHYNEATHCSTIHRRAWQDGELVMDEVFEVCETHD